MSQTSSPRSPESSPQGPQARSPDPVVGILYNPRSHRNQGRDLDVASRANVYVAQPASKEDIAASLKELADRKIDFLIINGGDGTVRDALTCGQVAFGNEWPDLAVLPKGKTNALNVDLGAPAGWTLSEAIDAYQTGRRIKRRPVSISPANGDAEAIPGCGRSMLGFILGGGAFTLGVQAGQDAHKMGAFNSLAVGVTTAWGVLSGLLGSNENMWRRGTAMRFLLGKDRRELPHCGLGDPARRSVFLASTLEKFPAGMKLFGAVESGLKLVVLDRPRRRMLSFAPILMAGWVPDWVKRGGFHQVAAEEFELMIEDEYILDGEAYPGGTYTVTSGPELSFVVP